MESASGSYYGYSARNKANDAGKFKNFKCETCGHTPEKPFPPLPKEDKAQKVSKFDEITCYATRVNILFNSEIEFDFLPPPFFFFDFIVNIEDGTNDVFGFGIAMEGNPKNPSFTSPCEYITAEGFQMLKSTGKVESVMRDVVQHFIPLYINPTHAKSIYFLTFCALGRLLTVLDIKQRFEQSIKAITNQDFTTNSILSVLAGLMNSAVVAFMKGEKHTSERALHGYFAFHRLFLWATTEYPSFNSKKKRAF